MEEQVKAGISIPSISAEDLSDLPLYAMVALATRAAWRVLPGTVGIREEDMEAVVVALATAGMAALGRQINFSVAWGASRLGLVGNVTANAAFSAAYAAASANDGYVASTVTTKIDTTQDVVQWALDSINLSHSYVVGDGAESDEATRQDLEWLRNWSTQKRAMDGLIAPEFFERQLWEREGSSKPPVAWQQLIAEWSEVTAQGALSWLVEMYHGMLQGNGLDWDHLNRFLNDWYARYQEREASKEKNNDGTVKKQPKAKGDKAEKDVTPTPDSEPVLLEGGIVTAAADVPAHKDHLGRTPLVRTLADMLASPDQSLPMTIALLGDWGSGKSSVIAQLMDRLQEYAEKPGRAHYLFAEFNAWEYEQTDNIQAGLAQEVVRGLTSGLDWQAKFRLAIANAAKQHGWDFYLAISGLLVAGVLGLLGVINMDKLSALNPMTQSVLGTGGAAVLLYTLLRTWQQTRRFLEHPLAEKLSTYLQLPNYGKHLGLVPVIKSEIKSLCAARLGENKRLLVVVDDLDRCKPAYITETLDAIRLVMNLDQVAVIIAIDDRIAFRAVADHYRNLAEDGKRSKEEIARDYLGKIIQLPINLYNPWPWEVSGFIKDYLFQIEDVLEKESSLGKKAAVAATKQIPDTVDSRPEPSPAARRLLEEHEINPIAVKGSGQNGRILKKDVENYLEMQQRSGLQIPGTGLPQSPLKQSPPDLPSNEKPGDATSDEEQEVLMRDSCEEQELFAQLASEMGFANPRQLIRLHNSYRMLKGYRHSRKKSGLDFSLLDDLMHGLFWYEYLYQRKQQKRRLAELVIWEWGKYPEWEQRASRQEENPPAVVMARWLRAKWGDKGWSEKYRLLLQTVEMVVLPNAEMGLMLSQSGAEDELKGLSTSDDPSIDPWG